MDLGFKILVVDDDSTVTSSLRILLNLEGFTDVAIFNTPVEAVEYLKENPRDVIISDFKMPEMDGLEFLSKARVLYPNASMILLTGYADKEKAIRAINEVGLYKYIEKPWDNDELIINIKNAYERSQLISSLEEKNNELEKYSSHLEDLVKEKTADIVEMNEQLSAIINNCADGIILFSEKNKVLHVNPACESLFGLSEEIFKNKSAQELFVSEEINWTDVFQKQEEQFLRDIYIDNVVNGNKTPVELSCAYIPAKSE